MAKKYYSISGAGMGKDGGMIQSNYSAPSNLPQESMMKEYPKIDYTGVDGIDDTIKGVDQQMNADARGGKRRSPKAPGKW